MNKPTIAEMQKENQKQSERILDLLSQNKRLEIECTNIQRSFNMVKENFEREKDRVDGLIKALNK